MNFIEIKKTSQDNYTSLIRINKKDNIVEKIIDYNIYSDELFQREIYWLIKLYSTNVVPKLIDCDPLTHTICMYWCGEVLSEKK